VVSDGGDLDGEVGQLLVEIVVVVEVVLLEGWMRGSVGRRRGLAVAPIPWGCGGVVGAHIWPMESRCAGSAGYLGRA
jgi:hypothetical protein